MADFVLQYLVHAAQCVGLEVWTVPVWGAEGLWDSWGAEAKIKSSSLRLPPK